MRNFEGGERRRGSPSGRAAFLAPSQPARLASRSYGARKRLTGASPQPPLGLAPAPCRMPQSGTLRGPGDRGHEVVARPRCPPGRPRVLARGAFWANRSGVVSVEGTGRRRAPPWGARRLSSGWKVGSRPCGGVSSRARLGRTGCPRLRRGAAGQGAVGSRARQTDPMPPGRGCPRRRHLHRAPGPGPGTALARTRARDRLSGGRVTMPSFE